MLTWKTAPQRAGQEPKAGRGGSGARGCTGDPAPGAQLATACQTALHVSAMQRAAAARLPVSIAYTHCAACCACGRHTLCSSVHAWSHVSCNSCRRKHAVGVHGTDQSHVRRSFRATTASEGGRQLCGQRPACCLLRPVLHSCRRCRRQRSRKLGSTWMQATRCEGRCKPVLAACEVV